MLLFGSWEPAIPKALEAQRGEQMRTDEQQKSESLPMKWSLA